MPEIHEQFQSEDFSPPRAGRTLEEPAETQENLRDQGDLAPAPDTLRDASRRNDSATAPPETGKIRGICSPDVPDEVRAAVSTPRPDRVKDPRDVRYWLDSQQALHAGSEIDRRLHDALYDAGRSALGMPATVDTFKAMLEQAGLALVLA